MGMIFVKEKTFLLNFLFTEELFLYLIKPVGKGTLSSLIISDL